MAHLVMLACDPWLCRKLLMGVDLTKGFYFSFTYHLAATLQSNYEAGLAGAFAASAGGTRVESGIRLENNAGQPLGPQTSASQIACGKNWCIAQS